MQLNQPGCSIRVVPLNENIPILALENVTSFIFTYSSCTNLCAQDVAKIWVYEITGHSFIYLCVGIKIVYEYTTSTLWITPNLDSTYRIEIRMSQSDPFLARMKKYSTCLNFSWNIEYPPASYRCTNKRRKLEKEREKIISKPQSFF